MQTLFVASLLVIRYLSCGCTNGYPTVLVGDPWYSIMEKIKDPKQADTLMLRIDPSIQIDTRNMNAMEGHYRKTRYENLNAEQQRQILANIFEINPMDKDNLRGFETEKVWVNAVESPMELQDAEQQADQYTRNHPEAKWTSKSSIIHATEHIRIQRPVFRECAGIMTRLSIWMKQSHYVMLYQRRDSPYELIWVVSNGTVKFSSDKAPFPFVVTNQDYDSLCQLHANYTEMRGEIERIKQIKVSLKDEKEAHQSLKETHHQTVVIGALIIGLAFAVLVMVIAFACRMRGGRNAAAEAGRNSVDIPSVLIDYRPRSMTIDELHHKFGMNEIDKVTAKEGGDLVKIARPLETVGAERKLSEELFGITPIISDGNGGTKQTNDTDSQTRSEGEQGDGP